jgi:alpha-galactosidase/6-phospho-beta-glucosidase family protein
MNFTPRNLTIAYIGGGSRGWAWGMMADLAADPDLAGTVRLFDTDIQAAKDNEAIGNKYSAHPQAKGKWRYVTAPTLEDALKDADFVVVSILPGSFKEMESDVHTPESYGIYQSVGDTVGPGGLLRALRTIPMFEKVAAAIRDHAPEAWVINYTNPMSLCTRTLYAVFPEIKAFGCCHEVFGTKKLLMAMLSDLKGIDVAERDSIKVNVLGINHFTWLDSARYQDIDLFPLYKIFADKYFESGYDTVNREEGFNKYFESAHRVKFDLFRRYGLIAAAGDRHLAEFCPPWYLKNPETVARWKFGLTPVSWRTKDLARRIEKSKALLSGSESISLDRSGEEGVKQMRALLGLGDMVTNVNLPNRGQISNLPLDAVVETNAVLQRDQILPVHAGALPPAIHALVVRHVANQETTLAAAFAKDRELAFRAFANDPLVALDIESARKLFETMLNNTRAYLPGWF